MQALPKRSEVPKELTWDLETIYATNELWEQEYAATDARIPELAAYQGKLDSSAATLQSCLGLNQDLGIQVERLYAFAQMRRDEDSTNSKYVAMADRAGSLYVRFSAATAFLTPELLAIDPDVLAGWVESVPSLQIYRHYLEDLSRQRPHVRSTEVEELLAQSEEIGRTPSVIYHQLADADLKFPRIQDEHGHAVELSQGRYIRFMESPDRQVRQNAYTAFYQVYRDHLNTSAATHSSAVKAHVFYAQARRHPSALTASLHNYNIPTSVYHNLISTVRKNLPRLHRYVSLRKRLLDLPELRWYDMFVPIVPDVKQEYAYEQALATVCEALQPLGETYVADLRRGLASRWIDAMENQGKRSGAYSFGAYTTHPFVLLNYQSRLDDVFTIAHELGHSMHFFYTRRHQPFLYSDTNIFVAEVASTLNEQLLTQHLLRTTDDPTLRRYLINHSLDSFRSTLFRQTQFAEFELWTHEQVESGASLTADSLTEKYRQLVADYYGPDLTVDDDVAVEWSRIPHFYDAFYVYQYSTGISAAVALARRILDEGAPAVQRYLGFLRSGSADYAINLLRSAGVDMASPDPIQAAIDTFAGLLDEMEAATAR